MTSETPRSFDVWSNIYFVPVVNSAAITPQNQFITAGCSDGYVKVLDAVTGTTLAILIHPGVLHYISFSTTGSRLLSLLHDGTSSLWDATHWEHITVLDIRLTSYANLTG